MIYSPVMLLVALTSICESGKNTVYATIDVNLSELEYLAARLDPSECRRLVVALHYDSYELPKNLDEAVGKVSAEIPCLRQLLHWNGAEGEGRGKTHQSIEHRLRQLDRRDLADWLGRTAFKELGKDLLRSVDEPLDPRAVADDRQTTTTALVEIYPVTDDAIDDSDNEYFWLSIEVILMALFAVLIFTLLVYVGALIIDKFAWCRDENEKIPDAKRKNENRKKLSQ